VLHARLHAIRMSTFELVVRDETGTTSVPDVTSFVGEDSSGSFGILAGHASFVTALVTGLARFRTADERWHYMAMPGAVLHFRAGVLEIGTRRSIVDDDYTRISTALTDQLLADEEKLGALKESMRRMEDEVLRRLWELERHA